MAHKPHSSIGAADPAGGALPTRAVTNLQEIIEDSLRHASIGVVLGLEAPWLATLVLTAGQRDLAGGDNVARENLFQIGSQTKMFTAVCVRQLIAEKKLSLDTPVKEILHEAPFGPEIQIKHLLNHTSGLGNPSVLIDPINRVVDYPLSFAERLFLARVKGPAFEAGTSWDYNNLGYWLLEEIVSRVTGAPYGNRLRTHVLAPLDLRDTYVGSELAFPTDRMARGYHIDRKGKQTETTSHLCLAESGAAGDLVSSVDDMMTWLRALSDGRVLGVALSDLAVSLARCDESMSNSVEYGLGVQKFIIGGRVCWGHGGAMCGYMSMGLIEPVSGLRLCMLSNKLTKPLPTWTTLQSLGFGVVAMIVRTALEHAPAGDRA